MRSSVLEKNLTKQIEEKIRDVTPGLLLRAYQNGKMICDISVGDTYAYYDLASLTKIIFTTQALMYAFEKELWQLDSKVVDIADWFPHVNTTLAQLLTHSSGLIWWKPFYKNFDLNQALDKRWDQLKKEIQSLPLEKNDQSVYSDVGFLTLAFVLEKIYDRPLIEIWQLLREKFYSGTTFEFHPGNVPHYQERLYAPSEECSWRKKLIRGEVHDENAWALGGVSTHAGLFGSVDDIGWYSLLLRSQLLGIAKNEIKLKTAKLFASRARPTGGGDWALGFMMPSPGVASCGSHFSLNSIGHTGFTGTSVWYDPKLDLSVGILSNRTLYGRENKGFTLLRPQIHNWLIEGLRKASY